MPASATPAAASATLPAPTIALAVVPDYKTMQLAIAKAALRATSVLLLVTESYAETLLADLARDDALKAAYASGVLRVQVMNFDSAWIRDYGPLLVKGPRHYELLDAEYAMGHRGDSFIDIATKVIDEPDVYTLARKLQRAQDDRVPMSLAATFGDDLVAATTSVPIRIDGGNLVRIGRYCLISSDVATDVKGQDLDLGAIARQLRCRDVIALEPLPGETIKHIDMFLARIDDTHVMLADYHDAHGVLGARANEAMQRDAAILAHSGITVAWVPAIAPRLQGATAYYPTLLNLLVVEGRERVIVMPSYDGETQIVQEQAKATIAKLVPDARIDLVESTAAAKAFGAIHCLTTELPLVERAPIDARHRAAILSALDDERRNALELRAQMAKTIEETEKADREKIRRALSDAASKVWVAASGLKAWVENDQLHICESGQHVVGALKKDSAYTMGERAVVFEVTLSGDGDGDQQLEADFRPSDGLLYLVKDGDPWKLVLDRNAQAACIPEKLDDASASGMQFRRSVMTPSH